MSVITHYALYCDGGDSLCPFDGSPFEGSLEADSIKYQRHKATREGWVKVGKKDYCAECAKRLNIKSKKP